MPSDRDPLIVHSDTPYNAEPALKRLRAGRITETSDFYVRSHGNVPEVDAAAYRLAVNGRVGTPLVLSLADLRRQFETVEIEAVLQCAGNRRAELHAVKPVTGDPWAAGAIGNAIWTGVRLADVLAAAEAEPAAHVGFSALDACTVDGRTFAYGVSIPLSKARAPEVILAFAMNGAPLTPEHGFPLRLVVPGFAGVRSAKWLQAIEVRDAPSENPIQAEDYKLLPPDIDQPETIDWSRGMTIDALPVTSAICEPAAGADLPAGPLTVRGYAMASDRAIARVDVSADGGVTWRQASLEATDNPWSWTFWSADVVLAPGRQELVVRAWDSAGQTQPADARETWNVKGYLSTAWHRLPVTVA